MAAAWKEIIDVPTGETLEVRVSRRGGVVAIDSCIAHALFEHDGLEVVVHAPLHHRMGGFDFNVVVVPAP